jgi:threonine synthase
MAHPPIQEVTLGRAYRAEIREAGQVKYISTRGKAPELEFEDTLLAGLAEDGGLYLPRQWPHMSPADIAALAGQSYQDVALRVLAPFTGQDVSHKDLKRLIDKAYACFTLPEVAPLRHLYDQQYLLELFHGPTLAFKDVAMQLLALLMDHALTRRNAQATIVGATSGDTGGAAIEAFRGKSACEIFILYPQGRVSDVQRKQMTTPREDNVHAVAVEGTFDDCQALVKAMFNDQAFRKKVSLAGVNSINWVRVMAQTVYYFTAALQLGAPKAKLAFSVPTGNFGDIFAGYVAARMGLPIEQLMIATNVNDILARTLASGRYQTGEVVATSSPSMDIQVSSNFERLLFEVAGRKGALVEDYMRALRDDGGFDLAPAHLAEIRQMFAAARIDQDETAATIARIYERLGMILDPHTAVGLAAAEKIDLPDDVARITLATAHPAKFPDAVQAACGLYAEPPAHVAAILDQEERSDVLANDLTSVQDYILSRTRHAD